MINIEIEYVHPLAPLQQGMLFQSLQVPESGVYVIQVGYRIEGDLHIPAFRQAWIEVAERHAALRSCFIWKNVASPIQVVLRKAEVLLRHIDWRELTAKAQQVQLEEFLQVERKKGFELSRPPLMRLALIRLADDMYEFIWCYHHLLIDGWSLTLLQNDLMSLYHARRQGHSLVLPPTLPFRDYIAWLFRQDLTKAEEFWRHRLRGFLKSNTLSIDLGAGLRSTGEEHYEREVRNLQVELTTRLQQFAREYQLTLSTLMHGVWAILLARYSGEADVLFGTVMSGRPSELIGVETMVGALINTLPVRVAVRADDDILSWLKRVQDELLELRQFEYSPLTDVQAWSDVPRGSPLFETILIVENYPVRHDSLYRNNNATSEHSNTNLRIHRQRVVERGHVPLSVLIAPNRQMQIEIRHNATRFETAMVERMLSHWECAFEGLVANPRGRVDDISLLTASERRQVLEEWNATRSDYRREACLHELIEEQAAAWPDRVAVVFEDRQLTYGELNRRANQLGHELQQRGVGPEVPVGVCLERSLELMIALLAVLKAGGVYVPLDPEAPLARLAYMLEDAGIAVLVTQERVSQRLPSSWMQVITFEADGEDIAAQSTEDVIGATLLDQLAYVIYTSGSTGRPKGVMISHFGLMNYLTWCEAAYEVSAGGGAPVHSSVSVDMTVTSLWAPLLAGSRVVLVADEVPVEGLGELLAREGDFSLLKVTPSHLEVLREQLSAEQVSGRARRLVIGGEALHEDQLQWWRTHAPATRLINEYGPTETVVGCCVYESRTVEAGRVPIGRPIANTQIYVLDVSGQPVPVGVPGELYIGGAGLARGYRGRPELTAERFVPDPFGPAGGRLYRTGDLARYRADGTLEYLGRMDHQVKLRGFRIELGEIEAVLRQCPGVSDAVVMVREDQPGQQQLAGYVVGDIEDVAEVRESLKRQLPDYMVPTAWLVLKQLPLTASGKIDRRALPPPDVQPPGTEAVLPRTAVEELLAGIWQDVLGHQQVSVNDDFFALGGHSLLATQVTSRIRQTFAIELPLRDLFEAPQLWELAERIEHVRSAGTGLQSPPLVRLPRTGPLPLSFAQQRLWFIDQLTPGSAAYNVPSALRLRGPLQIDLLQKTFQEIVRRHEVLRTRFVAEEGVPFQVIEPESTLQLSIVDLTALAPEVRERTLLQLAREEAQRPFDLAHGPLLRAGVVRMNEEEHGLLVTLHHIVSDGWSMGILTREVTELYAAFVERRPSPLKELPIQYADYAVWQRQWLQGDVLEQQLAYWKEQLAGELPVLQLPTDRPRPAVPSFRGGSESFQLSQDLSMALQTVSRQEDVTVFMLLLASFQILLSRYSGQSDILVGTPIANRTHTEIEGLIGFFINTLVLRSQLSGELTVKQLLHHLREVTLGAYAHQDLPFEQLVEALPIERDPSRNPLFQVIFTLENIPVQSLHLAKLSFDILRLQSHAAHFDLSLVVMQRTDQLAGSLNYRTDMFDATTAQRTLRHWQTLLDEILTDSSRRVGQLSTLTPAEKQQLLGQWIGPETNYPQHLCLHDLFETQATQCPDAIAVVHGKEHLTYNELNRRANQLAHYLVQNNVQPEVRVGLCVERSLEMAIGLLGILKAGGAYVPLDPGYPSLRLASLLQDCGAVLLVTQHALAKTVRFEGPRICLDTDWLDISKRSVSNPSIQVKPEHIAYIIFTSGSTGLPKGILVCHQALVNYTLSVIERLVLQSSDRVFQFASLSFDVLGEELFPTWAIGATVVLPVHSGQLTSPADLLYLMERHQITALELPTTYWCQWLGELIDSGRRLPDALRFVIVGGEKASNESLRDWQLQGVRLMHVFGLTETTITSTFQEFPRDGHHLPTELTWSLGRPLANTQLYVLNTAFEPVQAGMCGELYIGGTGIARGYLNRPDLTAERFIPNLYSKILGARLFKTGDMIWYRPDGELEFIGRRDQQVKLRGFRVELGEIQSALQRHEAVRQAIVLVREAVPGMQQLVSYIIPEFPHWPTANQLREFLTLQLPEYMVPTDYVTLSAIPLTSNGKIDVHALPQPEAPESKALFMEPRNSVEEVLSDIWVQVLGLERVGVWDNFFQLGGHSLLATKVMSRLRIVLRTDVPLHMLFERPTIAELAGAILDTSRFPEEIERMAKTFMFVKTMPSLT